MTTAPEVAPRTSIPVAIKQAVRERDGNECQYCHIEVDWDTWPAPDSGTFDHVVPNNVNSVENLVVSCWQCNFGKRTGTAETWLMHLAGISPCHICETGEF